MVGASIARRTRSGTFVGPGICRKCRPLRWLTPGQTRDYAPRLGGRKTNWRGSCAARSAPTTTRGTSTRATRACTRATPLLVAFPRDAADVAAAIAGRRALRRAGAHPRRGHQPRRPGGGPGDRARHLPPHGRDRGDRRGRADRAGRPRRGAGRPQPRRRGARARVRAGHLDLQPGDARRHDRQQLLGQPLDRLRHDDRPRARRSTSCSPTARPRASAPSARRSGRRARRPTRSRAASTGSCRRSCAATRARSPRTTRATGASRAATGSTRSRAGSTSPSS